MKVGYARASTHEQNHDLQIDALQAAECERIHTDTCSGSVVCAERPELQRLCEQLREDDLMWSGSRTDLAATCATSWSLSTS